MSTASASPVTIDLLHPLQPRTEAQAKAGGEDPDAITFEDRPIYAGDLEVMDRCDGHVSQTNALIALLTGQPLWLIKRIDARDWQKLSQEVNRRLGNG